MTDWKKFTKNFILLSGFMAMLITVAANAVPTSKAANQTGEWLSRLGGDFLQQQRISITDGTNGWFLSFSYTNNVTTAYLAQYENFSWSPTTFVTHSQQITNADIEMISADSGWLILGGWLGATPAESSIYHWDGSNWNFVTMITDSNGIALTSLDVLSANNIWALGGGNFWSSLYRWDGSSWSYMGKSPGGVWPDSDLDMLTPTDGWAVGFQGAIARWDGSSLVQVASPTTTDLNAVSMVNSSSGWAVGDAGTILRWNGSSWTTYASPITADLEKVQMVSIDDGWIIGANVVLHWDGTQWGQVSMPVTDSYHDIDMVSASEGWMIGNSILLQYVVPEPKLTMSYTSGAPGSYFNVLGQNFPANSTANILVNGRSLGTAPVSANGSFAFTLTTANADAGSYYVTASVNPSATKQFTLNVTDPVRAADSPADLLDVPAGIAFNQFLYLPTVIR